MPPLSNRRPIRPFYLYRSVDKSGVSGTGLVAVGVLLPSGKAVLEWCSRWKTITVFESIDDIVQIHGHGGNTVLRWGLPTAPVHGVGDLHLRVAVWIRALAPVRWLSARRRGQRRGPERASTAAALPTHLPAALQSIITTGRDIARWPLRLRA